MSVLTDIQAQILDFIKASLLEEHRPPTMREIAEYMGYRSDNAAYQHLQALQRKGYIELDGRSRGINLLAPLGVPVVGRVAAGSPVLAEEHIEDYVPIPNDMFRKRVDYFLRVTGDSMKGAGILDGDLLAVRKIRKPEQNQIVVARIEDEVTVKRFRQRGNIVTLLPENPKYSPIKVDLRTEPFAIEGAMAGLIRSGA